MRRIAFAIASIALTGCAHTYVDRDGNTHVVGLVHVVVPNSGDPNLVRAQALQVTSIGLSVLTSAERTSLTLGYNDDTLVLVRGDTCVAIAPGGSVNAFDFQNLPSHTAHRKDAR